MHYGSMVKRLSRGTVNPLFLVRIQVDPQPVSEELEFVY